MIDGGGGLRGGVGGRDWPQYSFKIIGKLFQNYYQNPTLSGALGVFSCDKQPNVPSAWCRSNFKGQTLS